MGHQHDRLAAPLQIGEGVEAALEVLAGAAAPVA